MRNFWTLLLCCALLPLAATAQNTSQAANTSTSPWRSPYTYRGDKTAAIAAPIEISVGYSYLHATAKGAGLSMNGGSTEVAFHTWRWFSAVADLTGERSGSVNGGPHELSLASFTLAKARRYLRLISPFSRLTRCIWWTSRALTAISMCTVQSGIPRGVNRSYRRWPNCSAMPCHGYDYPREQCWLDRTA